MLVSSAVGADWVFAGGLAIIKSAGDEHGRARCKEGHDGGGVREGRGSQYPAACAMRSSEKAPGRLGERAVRLCGWLAVV